MPKRPKKLTAREIAVQAADYILSSYWIKGDEVRRVSHKPDFPKFIPLIIPKGIAGRVSTEYATGVCSIGAFALASAVLREKPISDFASLANRDLASRLAASALIDAILATLTPAMTRRRAEGLWDWSSAIIQWNDMGRTKREDVVKAFEETVKSPVLDFKKAYFLEFGLLSSSQKTFYKPFKTKKQAEEWGKAMLAGGKDDPVQRGVYLLLKRWKANAYYSNGHEWKFEVTEMALAEDA